ncbi:MAG: DNA polymerase III subunit beta [Candidatus Absconditabacterales bacterium]
MQITLQTAVLKNVLDLASRYVAKNSTLPVLQHVYMKTNVDTILFRATDMEKYIDIEVPATVDTQGALSVDARMLTEYIRSLDDENVTLIMDMTKNTLTLKTASDTIKIKGLNGSEYVGIPELNAPAHTVSALGLLKGLNKVDFAVQEKTFVPVLQGVLVKSKEYDGLKKLVFAGSDSLRLADYKISYDGNLDDLQVIVPKNNIAELKRGLERYLSLGGVDCQLMMSNNLIGLEMKTTGLYMKVVSLLISGNFPEYENENVMPSKFETSVIVNKNDIEKAIRKVNILTRDTNYFVIFDIADGKMVCDTGTQMDMGEAQSTLAADITGPGQKIALNGKHILDIIRVVESDKLQINLIANDKPVIIKDLDDPGFTYVCKPINL